MCRDGLCCSFPKCVWLCGRPSAWNRQRIGRESCPYRYRSSSLFLNFHGPRFISRRSFPQKHKVLYRSRIEMAIATGVSRSAMRLPCAAKNPLTKDLDRSSGWIILAGLCGPEQQARVHVPCHPHQPPSAYQGGNSWSMRTYTPF